MKIYKDFHNLSFPRHILQKFHFDFKFYCAYPQIQARLYCAKQKKPLRHCFAMPERFFLYSGIGSRIRSVNQPSAQ